MAAMKTFLAVFNTLPAILQSVQAVEAALPMPKAGTQKLNLILGVAGAAWEMSQSEQPMTKSTTMSVVQMLANITVAGLNAAGVFKQSTPAPATPVSSN
jgi:hypothetical protein